LISAAASPQARNKKERSPDPPFDHHLLDLGCRVAAGAQQE
jgi:hypothetical protein